MKKITTLLALLLFAVSQGAFAQRTITGKVISQEDGLGMVGVYVVVKGTTTGTTTDTDGNFTLNVPNNATIIVSFMGFKTVELPVGNQTRFDVTLQPDAVALSDVVVRENRVIPPERVVITALGIARDKKTLTTSIQTVSGEEINRASELNPLITLRDRTPGLSLSYADEIRGPGTSVIALIRGRTSWNHLSAPLLVVDGVPWGLLDGGLASERLTSINPDQIEDITVLRSANAAMLYGSDAANGAILIRLKK